MIWFHSQLNWNRVSFHNCINWIEGECLLFLNITRINCSVKDQVDPFHIKCFIWFPSDFNSSNISMISIQILNWNSIDINVFCDSWINWMSYRLFFPDSQWNYVLEYHSKSIVLLKTSWVTFQTTFPSDFNFHNSSMIPTLIFSVLRIQLIWFHIELFLNIISNQLFFWIPNEFHSIPIYEWFLYTSFSIKILLVWFPMELFLNTSIVLLKPKWIPFHHINCLLMTLQVNWSY